MSKFDLTKTAEVATLFETPRDQRDQNWMQQFYVAVPDASLMSFDPQVKVGPDQFPYFQMSIPEAGPFTTFCVTHILDYVLDNGLGIAIFGDSSRSDGPQWVFTFGDLLSFSLYGRFDGNPADQTDGSGATGGDGRVLQAAPSESYLPACARKALARYMRQVIQHPDPKVALVVDPRLSPARNLMLNLTLEQYHGNSETLDAAMRYLTWFVPRSYSLMPMPPEWNDSGFVALD
jgi:hypothetical protein